MIAPSKHQTFDSWWDYLQSGDTKPTVTVITDGSLLAAKRPRHEVGDAVATGPEDGGAAASDAAPSGPSPYAEGSDGLSSEIHREIAAQPATVRKLLATCRRVAAHAAHLPGNGLAAFQVTSEEDARCSVQFDAQVTLPECALVNVDGSVIPFTDEAGLARAITAGHRAIVALNDIDRCFTNPLRGTRVAWELNPSSSQIGVLSLTSSLSLDHPSVSGVQGPGRGTRDAATDAPLATELDPQHPASAGEHPAPLMGAAGSWLGSSGSLTSGVVTTGILSPAGERRRLLGIATEVLPDDSGLERMGYGPRENNRTADGYALGCYEPLDAGACASTQASAALRCTLPGSSSASTASDRDPYPELQSSEAWVAYKRALNAAERWAAGHGGDALPPSSPPAPAPSVLDMHCSEAMCDSCHEVHATAEYICPAEVGLPMQSPELEAKGACGLSRHEFRRCSCNREEWEYQWNLRADVLRRQREVAAGSSAQSGRSGQVLVLGAGTEAGASGSPAATEAESRVEEVPADHDLAQGDDTGGGSDADGTDHADNVLAELRRQNEMLVQALRDSSAELVAARSEADRAHAARHGGGYAPTARHHHPPGSASRIATPATARPLPCGGSPLRASSAGSLGTLMSALRERRAAAQRTESPRFDLNDTPTSCATIASNAAGGGAKAADNPGPSGGSGRGPADAVLEAAEKMAAAQAGQYKLIRKLHGEVEKLKGHGIIAGARAVLGQLVSDSASTVRQTISSLSWFELWAVLATAGWLGPKVLPALWSRLVIALSAWMGNYGERLLGSLLGTRAGAALNSGRLSLIAWLLRMLSMGRREVVPVTDAAPGGTGGGGGPTPALSPSNATLAAAVIGRDPTACDASTSLPARTRLAPVLEDHVCVPLHAPRACIPDLSANSAKHAALLQDGGGARQTALCDSGATVDCCTTDIGRVPDSFVPDAIDMAVGDSDSSLRSPGTWLHALTRIGADGTEEDGLFRMYYTPSGIANIFSEPLEVNQRGASIDWQPGQPRVVTTAGGTRLPLRMADNGLGWLQIRAITDPDRLRALVRDSGLACRPAAFGVIPSSTAMVSAAEAPTVLPTQQSPLTPVGMGRGPKLTGLEMLRRYHAVLGHPSLPTLLATMADASDVDTSTITKADIEAFVREGCGVCESAKMKRPGFPRVADRTPKPIGKFWTFDSLQLRVPAAQFKYRYITRFVNEAVSPGGVSLPGMKRSYGHLALTSEQIEGKIQLLRAWVRPVHGEVHVTKHDSLPAQESRSMQDFMIDSKLHDVSSAPYCHEGVGSVEVTWLHDVPSANAQLFACGDGEEHFYTSFLTVETATNEQCGPGRKSRATTYYGRDGGCRVSHCLAYGSPVKYLTHPEIRDSKFDEHALPGIYRGPSRDDESAHRCWVSVGVGAALRHTTVDIGCMRIDERGVLARCDRSHPALQPHALQPVPPAPAADHSRWLNPAHETYRLLDVWNVNTPLPTSPFVLILGAGEQREEDICAKVAARSQRQLLTVPIDKCRGGYEQDWTIPAVRERLCVLAASEYCVLVIYMFDCSGWSVLRFKRPGPEPLFDLNNLSGITGADGATLSGALMACDAVDSGLVILRAAHAAGTATLGESPVGRGKGSPFAFKAKGYELHVSAWTYPPLAAELEQAQAVPVYADQGAAGAATQKTTQFMAVGDAIPPARNLLGSLQLQKRMENADSLVGAETGDYSRASAARQYPPELCDRIAQLAVSVRDACAARDDRLAPGATADFATGNAEEPASRQRPRREASDARYDKDGRLLTVTANVLCTASPGADECPLAAQAAVVAVGRSLYDASSNDHRHQSRQGATAAAQLPAQPSAPPTVITVRAPLVEIATHEVVQSSAMFAVLPGSDVVPLPSEHDVANALAWHEPRHFGEYKKSPQRALWRTAKELKMDEYRSLLMFELVPEAEVRAKGHKVMRTVWAYKIKFDKNGVFQKLNPRWCVVGTEMDRDVYESHADTVRWSTVLVLAAIRAHYAVEDWQFDIGNAFQATRTDSPDSQHLPELYYEQAKEFEEYGAHGEKLVCRALTAHQGRIDSARLFSTKFGQTLLKRVGCRRAVWDPQLWCFHNGALAGSDASLDKVLAAAVGMPAINGAPQGWAVFGLHVDDGIGLVSSDAVQSYITARIAAEWEIKSSRWQKVLGYTFEVDDDAGTVSVSCVPSLQAAVALHAGAAPTFQPKHPYSMGIQSVGPGVKPPDGSPELAEFEDMQTKCRKGLGLGIWQQRAHVKMTYPINYLCGYMSSPSVEVYKHYKHTLLHEAAYPGGLVFGGGGKRSLVNDSAPVPPFTSGMLDYGLHLFVDGNLGTPTAEKTAIADGSSMVHPSCHGKSFSGVLAMLGGAPIESLAQRQHLHAPEAYTSEVHAAGTGVHRAVALRGLLDELRIVQEGPTVIYCDSASAIFVAEDSASIKRSVWIHRRAAVLREMVDMKEVKFVKVHEKDNCADGFTKPIKNATLAHHLAHILPHFNYVRVA